MTTVNNTAYTNFPAANYIWSPRTDIFANGDGYFMYVVLSCALLHLLKLMLLRCCVLLSCYLTAFVVLIERSRYPGSDGSPIRSARLAGLRDGLEDWELFQHLSNSQALRAVVQDATHYTLVSSVKQDRWKPKMVSSPSSGLRAYRCSLISDLGTVGYPDCQCSSNKHSQVSIHVSLHCSIGGHFCLFSSSFESQAFGLKMSFNAPFCLRNKFLQRCFCLTSRQPS
jgi:hypothetical protein